jgi:hypothetical protein
LPGRFSGANMGPDPGDKEILDGKAVFLDVFLRPLRAGERDLPLVM